MSYGCTISFKQISGDEVFEFMQKFKDEVGKHLPEIAEQNYIFSPLCRNSLSDAEKIIKIKQKTGSLTQEEFNLLHAMREKVLSWAAESIFCYRWFYDNEHRLLGVYSVDNCIQHLFDNTVHFQDSCDQDYQFDEWHGVEIFEKCAEKWENASFDEVNKAYNNRFETEMDIGGCCDLDYYRRSACYDEIWKMFSNTLFDDNSVVYLKLYGFYDYKIKSEFFNEIVCATTNFLKTVSEKRNIGN